MGILFSVIGALVGAIIVYIVMRRRQEEVKQINRAQLEAFDKEVQEKKVVTQRLIDSYNESLERAKQENNKALEHARRYNQEQLKQVQSDYYNKVQDYTNQAEEQKIFLNRNIAELQAKIVALEKDYDHKIADFDRQWQSLMKERREAMDKLEEENLDDYLDQQMSLESQYQKDKAKLQSEIDNLSALRTSLIEAQIREQKLKDEQDFYRIHLSIDAQEDIDKLLRFAKECHSQQPLRKLIWSEYFLKPFGEMAGRILGKDKISGIYKITNIKDGKIYIGQSTDIKTRWSNHIKAALKIDSIAHSRVHDAMGDEGIWNFTFELLEQCPKEKLNEREKYYIEFYQSNIYGYNKTIGGA